MRKTMVGLLALALAACGGSEKAAPATGGIKLDVRSAAATFQSNITCVGVIISPNGGTPVHGQMFNSHPNSADGLWQFRVDKLPVGPAYITATAYDNVSACDENTPNPLYRVDNELVSITPAGMAQITLWMQEVHHADPFKNSAPYITKLLTNSATVVVGERIQLDVSATDPDGDALTYSWRTSPDSSYPAAGASTSWVAPANGVYTLTVDVSDGKGGTASASIRIDVDPKYATGGVEASVDMNNWPQVTRIVSTNVEAEAFSPFQLEAFATDADGDALSYAWTASCSSFTASTKSITFTGTQAGPCVLKVVVSDGRGGTGEGTIQLQITNAPVIAAGPRLMVRWMSPFTMINPDGAMKAEIAAIPLDNNVWNKTFVWDDGMPGAASRFVPFTGADPNGDHSDVWYTPPACEVLGLHATHVLPITVSVSDNATGATNTVTSNMTVFCQ